MLKCQKCEILPLAEDTSLGSLPKLSGAEWFRTTVFKAITTSHMWPLSI